MPGKQRNRLFSVKRLAYNRAGRGTAVPAGRVGDIMLCSGTRFEVEPWVVAAVLGAIALVCVVVVALAIRGQRQPVNTGREGLIGQTAVVRSALDPKGTVLVEGEIWNAWMEGGRAGPGEEVTVLDVEGLRLKVARKSE